MRCFYNNAQRFVVFQFDSTDEADKPITVKSIHLGGEYIWGYEPNLTGNRFEGEYI